MIITDKLCILDNFCKLQLQTDFLHIVALDTFFATGHSRKVVRMVRFVQLQIIEKSWYVTPVTDGGRKVENRPETTITYDIFQVWHFSLYTDRR